MKTEAETGSDISTKNADSHHMLEDTSKGCLLEPPEGRVCYRSATAVARDLMLVETDGK